MCNWRKGVKWYGFKLGVFCLLFSLSPLSLSKDEDIHYYDLNAGQWHEAGQTLEVFTAINESESIVLKLKNIKGSNLTFKIQPLSGVQTSIKLFWVKQSISPDFIKMDALSLVKPNTTLHVEEPEGMLLIKTTIPLNTEPREYNWKLIIQRNKEVYYESIIKVFVYPIVLNSSKLRLQGNVLFKTKGINEKKILGVLQEMKKYEFDSVILPRRIIRRKKRSQAFDYANNNFSYIRLPPQKLFTRKKTLSSNLYQKGLSRHQWLNSECQYISQLVNNFQRKGGRAKLVYKLWDEPVPKNYEEVVFTYKGVSRCIGDIKLEITEEPSRELGNIADIWTININKLDANVVKEAHRSGGQAYLYANYLHKISDNPYRIRTVGWILESYELDGYHFWSVANWQHGMFAQKKAITGREERGTLFYFDESTQRVLSSLRMESFREGWEDMQLLRQVKSCAKSNEKNELSQVAQKTLASIYHVLDSWDINNRKSNPPNFFQFRKEMLEVVSDCRQARAI